MRIAHVLTYVSTDGAFGGPVSVAVAQTAELSRRGHEVEIFAGWDGEFEFKVPGVKVNLFKTTKVIPAGFSGMIAPSMIKSLLQRSTEFDIVHVHLARDLITTPAALAVLGSKGHARLFVQSHGMVKPDQRTRTRFFDYGIRSILRRCQSVFALNDVDAERILAVAGTPVSVLELPNGVQGRQTREYKISGRAEVLFLARLHERKRVMLFAQAAARLIEQNIDAEFTIIGPDEGDLPKLSEFVDQKNLGEQLRYEGVVLPGQAPERIREAAIYVLPSRNEPFPMSVLEALSVGTPTVISNSCHIAEELVSEGAAVAFDGESEELAELLQHLLGDKVMLGELSVRAQRAIQDRYSISRVAELLENFYISDRASLRDHERQYSQ